jgi:hypothetical protein
MYHQNVKNSVPLFAYDNVSTFKVEEGGHYVGKSMTGRAIADAGSIPGFDAPYVFYCGQVYDSPNNSTGTSPSHLALSMFKGIGCPYNFAINLQE